MLKLFPIFLGTGAGGLLRYGVSGLVQNASADAKVLPSNLLGLLAVWIGRVAATRLLGGDNG
jgi:fluoride ion exporter CrcB/FEX